MASAEDDPRPNVLFISVDDLNDWIGVLGGHPQAKTPNIDRLANSGMLFTNAYCAAASCNPSRSALMTGVPPHKSGLYTNNQKMREVLPTEEILSRYLANRGYWSAGSGKILHYFIDAASWDDYFPPKEKENPFPRTFYPRERPVSIPREPWQYIETDWGAMPVDDAKFGGDYLVAKWISEQLEKQHSQPFFLACGIYRPHEPWFVPEKYFEPFPLESIQLPAGYREHDIDDLPPIGKRIARNRYFAHIQKHEQWKQAIRAYLASIYFADTQIGRVLDALERGPNRENTIVILWSDHGWHLGEKEHWQKYTGWRVCARVPLIVRVPPGTKSLPAGTTPGSECARPVSLVDLFSTITDLCGVRRKPTAAQRTLLPLLKNPAAEWPHAALTHLDVPGNYAISRERWRYIHYEKGGEELYDLESDPHEWTNLARDARFREKLVEFRQLAPAEMHPRVETPKKQP